MKQNRTIFYWRFIGLLQCYLIIEKYVNAKSFFNDKFYLWNGVVLLCSIVFLFNRMKRNKVLLNYEGMLLLMFILNCTSTAVAYVISGVSMARIIMTILILLLSIYIGISLKKEIGTKA
ncbi:hypothetical protein [Flavobacterium sp.]|uniref:hypothetical protein n=1 Tax=Flavobacterium sp. TaxID=239 RepID=UPI003D6ACCB8